MLLISEINRFKIVLSLFLVKKRNVSYRACNFFKSFFPTETEGNRMKCLCTIAERKERFFFVRTVESVSYVEEYQPDGVMHSSPAVSNFFEAWATVPGFVSYRSVEKGESEKLPMDYYRAAN